MRRAIAATACIFAVLAALAPHAAAIREAPEASVQPRRRLAQADNSTDAVKQEFDALDLNHDGELAEEEALEALKQQNVTVRQPDFHYQWADMLLYCDADHNGTLSLQEYRDWVDLVDNPPSFGKAFLSYIIVISCLGGALLAGYICVQLLGCALEGLCGQFGKSTTARPAVVQLPRFVPPAAGAPASPSSPAVATVTTTADPDTPVRVPPALSSDAAEKGLCAGSSSDSAGGEAA